jgi:hypothetical protein
MRRALATQKTICQDVDCLSHGGRAILLRVLAL